MEINHLLLPLLLVTAALVTCDSDLSSSEDYSAESSEELFGRKDDSSEESSEESKTVPKTHMKCVDYMKAEEVETCFVKRCEATCATLNKGAERVLKSCGWGCANQVSTFKAAQTAFHHTAADLLLGTAVDKCWDGCIEMFQESGQSSCISGCETMRRIQRDQLRANVELERKAAEKEKATDPKINEITKEAEDVKVNDIQSVEESKEDPGHLRTYILWHPMDQQQAYQAFNVMFNLAQKMFEDMDELDNLDNEKEIRRGWQDDRRQLRLPHFQPNPRVAALTSVEDEATDVYDKVADSLNNLKNKIQETVSEPAFKENMFYLLMTICCFLLLVALYDNCTEDTPAEPEEDHFLLFPDKASAAKLPTYEDCIKADKVLAVDLIDVHEVREAGDITKKDLNLSLSVVLDQEDTPNK